MQPAKKDQIVNQTKTSEGEILIYKEDAGGIRLDVRLENETVWLTQQMLADLFQTSVPNISTHIKNIYYGPY